MFFDGFTLATTQVPGGTVRYRIGGTGPALLLLHGSPQTHAMWHLVAPKLAERFTVICPDLRGYGGSEKPPATDDHAPYAKTAMATDIADLMAQLGHDTYAVAAHDRGARVAHRLALQHPDRVTKLAVLDIVPNIEHAERGDMAFALANYYSLWFAQPHPFPEDLIDRAPDTWFAAHTGGQSGIPPFFAPEALQDYLAAARDPAAIIGMCEDYRAAISIDLVHDRDSRARGKMVKCPMLVLWGEHGGIGGWYNPVTIWQEYCTATVTGGAIPSGHFIAEEAPTETLAWFERFFG
jgi:haloacetate dehalogenase